MATIITLGLMFLSVFVALFTITPIIIIFSFGIPYTMYLKKEGVVKTLAPIKKELLSVLILGTTFALYSWGIVYFTRNVWILIIGVGMPVIMSIGKVGKNPSNMSDYLTTNEEYIDSKKLKALEDLN